MRAFHRILIQSSERIGRFRASGTPSTTAHSQLRRRRDRRDYGKLGLRLLLLLLALVHVDKVAAVEGLHRCMLRLLHLLLLKLLLLLLEQELLLADWLDLAAHHSVGLSSGLQREAAGRGRGVQVGRSLRCCTAAIHRRA